VCSVFLYFERIPCEFGLDIEFSISVLFIQYFWTGITNNFIKSMLVIYYIKGEKFIENYVAQISFKNLIFSSLKTLIKWTIPKHFPMTTLSHMLTHIFLFFLEILNHGLALFRG